MSFFMIENTDGIKKSNTLGHFLMSLFEILSASPNFVVAFVGEVWEMRLKDNQKPIQPWSKIGFSRRVSVRTIESLLYLSKC